MIFNIVTIIVCYLLGSFPTSYLVGKVLRGIDIRKHGSGNVGATNTFRVLGAAPGILVLVLDIAKGLVAVSLIAPYIASHFNTSLTLAWLKILAGISVIAGHNWSIFLRFKGGKGVATSAGVLLGISAKSVGLAAIVWVIVTGVSRYVSLGSIISAVSLPIFMWLSGKENPTLFFGIAIAILIVVRHRANIVRLIHHRENKISLSHAHDSGQASSKPFGGRARTRW